MGQFKLDSGGLGEFRNELDEFIKNMKFNITELKDTIKYCKNFLKDVSAQSLDRTSDVLKEIEKNISDIEDDRDYLDDLYGGMNG